MAAYVDECEAIRGAHSYSVAASLIDPTEAHEITAVIRELIVPGQPKLHWYAEQPERRKLIAETIVDLPGIEHVVVVLSTRPHNEHPERRRRHCLTRLFPELMDLGVTHVTAEARQAAQNQRHVELLLGLRNQKLITGQFRVDHTPGPQEPLLAIADVVAGAVKTATPETHVPPHPRPKDH